MNVNILFITFSQLYPFQTGASIAQFGIIEYLSHLCNVSLLIAENHTPTDEELIELNRLLPKVKIYAIATCPPSADKAESKNVASKLRDSYSFIKGKIKLFLKTLLQVNKNEGSKLEDSSEVQFSKTYSSWNPYYIHSQEYVEKINNIIVRDSINIVQMEYYDNLNLVKALPSYVKKVFVEHECLFHRIKSHAEAKHIKSAFADYILEFYKGVEISLLENVDGIITFNDLENKILKAALAGKNDKAKFLVSPFSTLDSDFEEIERIVQLDRLIFIGGESHYPNRDAVEWFLEETAEEIFHRFGLRLYVVGNWSQKTVEKYKDHPSQVEFVGFVKDLHEISKSSISIAPVRIGGGLKTKILVAMARSIPVICTSFALEGINAKHLESVMIADDKETFCQSVEYLLADLERTYSICKNAQRLIKEDYSQSKISKQRYSFYQDLLKPEVE